MCRSLYTQYVHVYTTCGYTAILELALGVCHKLLDECINLSYGPTYSVFLSLTALLCPLVQPVSCDCDSKVGVREYVMWNIVCGSKVIGIYVYI